MSETTGERMTQPHHASVDVLINAATPIIDKSPPVRDELPMKEREHWLQLLGTARRQRFQGWKAKLRQWLCPVDYVRTREIPILLELFTKHQGSTLKKVLDVGSPQLLTCHLASSLPGAEVTYANLFPPEVDDLRMRQSALGLENLSALQVDVRQADLWPEASFDAVISCSVLEHIQDRAGVAGDTLAIQNLATCLRQGGLLAFSVPFSRIGFDEFVENPVYAVEGVQTDGRCFFQRFYDTQTIETRLIQPSGLEVLEKVFLGEERYHYDSPHIRLANRLAGRWTPLILGPLFPWIAHQVMRRDPDWQKLRKPYLAFYVLSKP